MDQLPTPPGSEYLAYETPQARPKGLAIASMVCGIASIPLMACAWFLAIPAAIVAVVLGFIANGRARRGEAEGRGMALAGIICGSSALVLAGLAVTALVAFLGMVGKHRAWTATTGPSSSATTSGVVSLWNSTPATAASRPPAPVTAPQR